MRERELASGKRLPVIALTAYTLKGDKEEFLALGFDGYVSKPLEVKKLVAEMKRVLDLIGTTQSESACVAATSRTGRPIRAVSCGWLDRL